VSYATPLTTVTALCFDAAEDVMIPCTTIVPVPQSTTALNSANSSAFPAAVNPFKYITGTKFFKALFGQSHHRASPYDLDHVVRLATSQLCAWDVVVSVLSGVSAVGFFS
jgi:hypothetical protein